MNIYIGNLSYTAREDEISKIFGAYGLVESVKIITDRDTGRSKGFAFITMPNEDEAKDAIAALDQKEFFGRKIKVVEARENTSQRSFNPNNRFQSGRRNY
ncbi:MAG TPA: RNA-binding protein [Bacteroidia bacterium]|nr:RNA-binding protein [Sphingobacteriales bacterium]HPD65977.1 RNA-binding protein [Bacteroidia bacterium]HRS59602.1 RNA-binding protein [Bacteroidia bacterium]HRU68869.1 RNA-binding protein [Bacteroidia bacterium]